MGVLADWQIEAEKIVISDFEKYDRAKQLGKMSWGVASYGYDARIGNKFRIFQSYPVTIVDPKNVDPACYREVVITDTDHIVIPAHSYVLGETVEGFCIPRSTLCIVVGKSSYARTGLHVNVTPGEPEWRGRWTVEVSNNSPAPVKLYCNEGIMQCIFIRTAAYYEAADINWRAFLEQAGVPEEHRNYARVVTPAQVVQARERHRTCLRSYHDKKGKYQDQAGLTNSTVTSGTGEFMAPIGHCTICHSPVCHHPNNDLYHDPDVKYAGAHACVVCHPTKAQ